MVLIAFVRHIIQPGKMTEAADRLNANGDRMSAQPGFVSRRLLAAADGADELATITIWESLEHYQAWQEHNRAANVHVGKESPYVGSPITEVYHDYPSATDRD